MSSQQREVGFTIVELVVTIVVIGIIGGSISMLFISTQRIQARTSRLEAATRAAHRQVEVLRNRNYNMLTPGEPIDFTDELPDSLPAGKTGTVTVSEPVPGLRRVDVTVAYPEGDNTKEIKLSSTIGIIGITQ